MKNILIIGRGSISKQHQHNIQSHFDLNIIEISEKENLSSFLINNEFDGAIICSSTSLHQENIIHLHDNAVPFYCEKPAFLNLNFLNKLKEMDPVFLAKCSIGFNLRYHSVIKKIREVIKKNYKQLFFSLSVGSDVREWRQSREIDSIYSLSKTRGGGAIAELSHEIDLAVYLFGPMKVFSSLSKADPWKSAVDGTSFVILENQNFSGQIMLDLTSSLFFRTIRIWGEDFHLNADLLSGKISLNSSNIDENFELEVNRNQTLKDSLFDFINQNKNRKNNLLDCLESSTIIAELYEKIRL